MTRKKTNAKTNKD